MQNVEIEMVLYLLRSHRQHNHSIERIRLPIQINRNYEAISNRFRDIIAYFPKIKEVTT